MTFEEDKNKSLADINNKLMKEAGFTDFQINTLLANVELIRQDAIKDYKLKVREAIDKLDAKCDGCNVSESKHKTYTKQTTCCPDCNHIWINKKELKKELGLTSEELER